jgi:hypothetical protein
LRHWRRAEGSPADVNLWRQHLGAVAGGERNGEAKSYDGRGELSHVQTVRPFLRGSFLKRLLSSAITNASLGGFP